MAPASLAEAGWRRWRSGPRRGPVRRRSSRTRSRARVADAVERVLHAGDERVVPAGQAAVELVAVVEDRVDVQAVLAMASVELLVDADLEVGFEHAHAVELLVEHAVVAGGVVAGHGGCAVGLDRAGSRASENLPLEAGEELPLHVRLAAGVAGAGDRLSRAARMTSGVRPSGFSPVEK